MKGEVSKVEKYSVINFNDIVDIEFFDVNENFWLKIVEGSNNPISKFRFTEKYEPAFNQICEGIEKIGSECTGKPVPKEIAKAATERLFLYFDYMGMVEIKQAFDYWFMVEKEAKFFNFNLNNFLRLMRKYAKVRNDIISKYQLTLLTINEEKFSAEKFRKEKQNCLTVLKNIDEPIKVEKWLVDYLKKHKLIIPFNNAKGQEIIRAVKKLKFENELYKDIEIRDLAMRQYIFETAKLIIEKLEK